MAFDNEPAGLPSHPEQPGRVFISYAAEDREKARRLGEYLGACGWQIWSDRNIPAGRAYDESIEEALRQSACVVVLWSRAAVNSRWVRSEASEGASRDVLVPALLEEVTIPLEFRLLPAVDLRSWDGSNDDVRLANVDEAIRQITNVVPATPDVSLSPEIARPPGRAARSIAVRVVAALLLLVLLAGSIWWWDAFHREHTEYFANVTKRWGFPEGIGWLSANQVATRNVSIAIVRRGRRALPREIRFVNAVGNAPPFGYHFSPLSALELNPVPRGGLEDPMNTEYAQLTRVLFSRDEEGKFSNKPVTRAAEGTSTQSTLPSQGLASTSVGGSTRPFGIPGSSICRSHVSNAARTPVVMSGSCSGTGKGGPNRMPMVHSAIALS
jgi:hypothetical protein